MNLSKQKAFNQKMGKAKHFPRHQNLSKGGMVDRMHLAEGGATTLGSSYGGGDVNAHTTQGGLFGNITQQSDYNAQLAPTTQFNYAPTVGAASTGALNATPVNQAIAAEQQLAGQYGDIAAGRGPNPALAALNQQTGVNVANTAALQAGQRGGAANAGLLARQIGQQGAATQQNAVGQAATLQANQQLGALGAQAGLQGQIGQQGLGEQNVNAGIYGAASNANVSQNNTNVANWAQAQGLNQATAAANTAATGKSGAGLISGIGGALSSIFHEGGEVHHLSHGGMLNVAPLPTVDIQQPQPTLGIASLPGAQAPMVDSGYPSLDVATLPGAGITPPVVSPTIGEKSVGSYIKDVLGQFNAGDDDSTGFKSLGAGIGKAANRGIDKLRSAAPVSPAETAYNAGLAEGGVVHPGPHKSHVANYLFAEGGSVEGKVPALVSPQEVYLNPHQVKEVVERGADPMKIGHHFPGKDRVSKNSQKNDVIPVELDDGGVVLPISVTTHKRASEKGRQFVEKAHTKRYLKKPKGI